MEITPTHLLAALLGYGLGAIPFGLVLTRLAGLGDVRDIGSGNIGATNVLRTGNKALALATLLLDGGKGAIAIGICWLVWVPAHGPNIALLSGVCAVIGHNFPIWLKFKGGKGVATTIGSVLAFSWPVGLAVCATWLLSAALFRISSLAALIALAAAPFYTLAVNGRSAALLVGVLAVLGIARHHANISRLLRGEEPRIGKKTSPPATPPNGGS